MFFGGTAGVLSLKPNGPYSDYMNSHVQYTGAIKVAGFLQVTFILNRLRKRALESVHHLSIQFHGIFGRI